MTMKREDMFLEDRHPAVLRGESLSVSYESRRVFKGLDLSIPEGQITVIVGPNACGKSSLLRTLSRLLVPEQGQVLLRDREIHRYGSREVARILGLLPQSSSAPAGICVADLVARGRFPHQTLLRQWTAADEQAVAQAMQATGVHSLADATLEELSGGQRQRVWLACCWPRKHRSCSWTNRPRGWISATSWKCWNCAGA